MPAIANLRFFLWHDLRYPEAVQESTVAQTYSQIALAPAEDAPFPLGRELAENLGYPSSLLDQLPRDSVEAFCGVSNVSLFAEIGQQDMVLDLGCGAGMDALVAAQRSKQVIGVDFSEAMLERASRALKLSNSGQFVRLIQAPAYDLPLPDASVDVVLVNGIFNLNPQRSAIMQEIRRVLRPGGSAFVAELVLREPLPSEQLDSAHWLA